MYSNGITITQGQLAQSSRPRASSFAQSGCSPSKKLIPSAEEYSCRICLDRCEAVHYCQCTGGMMCHQACLLEYLNNKSDFSSPPFCEVCKQPYNLLTTRSCYCSNSKLQSRIKAKPMKCVLYVVYLIFTVSVFGYLLKMLIQHQLKQDLITVAIAVLACLTIMFVFFMVIWFCDYPLVAKWTVLEVIPKARRKLTMAMEVSVEDML